VNPSGRLPLSFVSRTWHLALALGQNADMAVVTKKGLGEYFKPVRVTGGVELPQQEQQESVSASVKGVKGEKGTTERNVVLLCVFESIS
jgi:hypothetical protein